MKRKSGARKAAITILNMFDVGVIHIIKGTDIDRPYNAITLTLEMHRLFGNFDIFLERVTETPHTYNIKPFDPFFEKGLSLPVRRTFFDHPSIDPPLGTTSRTSFCHWPRASLLRRWGIH